MIPRVSIVLLVIALLTLAALQYHWIGQISVAERQRLEANVRVSSNRFVGDFNSEIRSLTSSLDFRGYEPTAAAIVARYRSWAENSGYPDLVRNLYVVRYAPTGEARLSQIDMEEQSFQLAEWPARLAPLRSYFQREPAGVERRIISTAPRSVPGLDGRLDGTSAVLIQLAGRPRIHSAAVESLGRPDLDVGPIQAPDRSRSNNLHLRHLCKLPSPG